MISDSQLNSESSVHNSSIKSSGIYSEGRSGKQNYNKKSICQQEIISENQSQYDDQLYNEQSSLPLCMKEYYLNEKQLNRLESKEAINVGDERIDEENISEGSTDRKSKDNKHKVNILEYKISSAGCAQIDHYHSTVQQRNKILSLELENQRIKNLHFEKMLSILIDEDALQRQKLQEMFQLRSEKIDGSAEVETQNRRLMMRNEELEREVTHYKELIYIANGNFEALEQKLQETRGQVSILELQKEQREKGFHQKLQNLKLVMKSLMSNLKNGQIFQNNENHQQRLEVKDAFVPENCYSFGDQDMNLRERKSVNLRIDKQQVFNSAHNKGKSTKPQPQNHQKLTNKLTMHKNSQEKENLEMSSRMEELFENKNYSSNKITTTFAKAKSPKNLTVEENYRKLFMKTLISSSQKPKN